MKIIVLLMYCVLGIPYIKSSHNMGVLQRTIIKFVSSGAQNVKAPTDCYPSSVSG